MFIYRANHFDLQSEANHVEFLPQQEGHLAHEGRWDQFHAEMRRDGHAKYPKRRQGDPLDYRQLRGEDAETYHDAYGRPSEKGLPL